MVLMSKELQQAVRASQGKPVHLAAPEETNVVYVVIPVEIYENLIQRLFYNDNPLTNEEQQNLLLKAGQRARWDDPEMDIYNDLDPRRQL
jgi:threonine aldolase